MMRLGLLIGLILVLVPRAVLADTPAWPKPYVVSNDAAFFKMLPGKGEWTGNSYVTVSEPYGVAYMLQDDGSFKELWRVSGWYAFGTLISRDGELLVRMGPWSEGWTPAPDHLAIAFYKNGIEMKSYSTADLIKDPNSVERSVSHYTWRDYSAGPPELGYDGRITIRTIEKIEYVFDANTGLMLEENRVEEDEAN